MNDDLCDKVRGLGCETWKRHSSHLSAFPVHWKGLTHIFEDSREGEHMPPRAIEAALPTTWHANARQPHFGTLAMDGGKLRICFVSDEVISKHIQSYRMKDGILVKSNEDAVPPKKAKKISQVSATPRTKNGHLRKKELEKENKTPSQTLRKRGETSNGSGCALRKNRDLVKDQRLSNGRNSNEDSESSGEDENDDEEESTDDEVQFKAETGKEKTVKKRGEAATKLKKKKTDENLSRLKEMAEEYFAVHHQKKIVTSDRTMGKLQNAHMTQKDLREHLADAAGIHLKECSKLFKQHIALFPKWIFQLRHGFNILLHGLGSKRRLLEEFRKQMLPDLVHVVVNGFFPSLTIKSILNMISDDILKYSGSFKNIIDQCNFIKSEFNSEEADELFLIIHNIDGQMLRNSKAQNAFSYLASASKIHIIASVDHINAPIIWDQNRSSRFNWLWYDVTTYDRYTEETSFENSLLVQQTGSLALSSLTHVLRSLTPNARGIFKLLVEYQLDGGDDYNGMSFGDLYKKCRENFLVNSDLTLRAQLTEFKDHKLIKFKKGADGVETLSIPLNSSSLQQFLEDNSI